MKQPSRKKHKVNSFQGTGEGIEFCNDCPFLILLDGVAICNASDVRIEHDNINKIIVPDWCGNKKQDESRI